MYNKQQHPPPFLLWPSDPLFLVKVRHPLSHLSDLLLRNLLDALVSAPVGTVKVGAVSTALDDANLVVLVALEGTTGSELGRQGNVSPGIKGTIGLHDARAVGVLPAARPLVDVLGALALLDAVGGVGALLGGEPQRTLLAPVVGVDEARDNGGAAKRGAILPPFEAVACMSV